MSCASFHALASGCLTLEVALLWTYWAWQAQYLMAAFCASTALSRAFLATSASPLASAYFLLAASAAFLAEVYAGSDLNAEQSLALTWAMLISANLTGALAAFSAAFLAEAAFSSAFFLASLAAVVGVAISLAHLEPSSRESITFCMVEA